MLKSGVGYSINSDAFLSGEETAVKALENLTSPKVAMLYASYQNIEAVIKGTKNIVQDIPIIGSTTEDAIIVPEGVISSESGFSGMMMLEDDDMIVSVAGSERGKNPVETGKTIALQAIKNSRLKIRPSYFYMVASPKEEELYLRGIEDVIGRVPFFGGSVPSSNGISKIFCNNQCFEDGCAVAFFYTTGEIVTEYTGDYKETSDMGIITKVNKARTLVEIDHVPALTKYAEWRKMKEEELKRNLCLQSVLSPLAVKDPLGNITVIRHPLVSNEDNSITISNVVTQGTAIIRVETTEDNLFKSIGKTLGSLNKRIDDEIGAYLLIHNIDRKKMLGNNMEKVYRELTKSVGDIPFLMIFTAGEYGYRRHSSNTCGSLMLSFTAFGK